MTVLLQIVSLSLTRDLSGEATLQAWDIFTHVPVKQT